MKRSWLPYMFRQQVLLWRSYVDEFTSIMIDFENLEIKYEEEDLALILLRSLPAFYKNFRDTLIYTKETLKVEDVKLAFFSKELMDKEFVQDTRATADALLVRNLGTKKKTCHYCKKIGHVKADCWKLKKKDQHGESAEANLVNEFEGNVLVVTENLTNFR